MNRAPSISPRDSGGSATPASPDPAALQRWVLAFCVIRFDLEQGQVMEECYPEDSLPSDLRLHIAFSSFPDSSSHHQLVPRHPRSSSILDSTFLFRLPTTAASDHQSFFIYGFVFNRRRLDARLPRGGEQKSVVILSRRPYSSVFRPLLQILGPLCFDYGPQALSLVAAHVASWPTPVPGCPMNLPIASSSLQVQLPSSPEDPSPVNFGLFHDADLFAAFRGLLLHLWTLWELLVIGEPILVIAPTPPQCSEAVAVLVGLVTPLLYSVDYRPYFTIHDPDFARLNSIEEGEEFPPMLLGVTNLFFLKALKNIPHVVSVGSPGPSSARVAPAVAARTASTGSGRNVKPGRLNLEQLSLNKFSPSNLLNSMKLRREGPLCLMTEHKEALWSPYTATMKPDTAVLNRLIDAGVSHRVEESMSVVNNEILRRHFVELTMNFLAPFGPYLRATTPSEGSSPYGDPPQLPPFHADEFLSSLSARGPGKFLAKRMRGNWLDLYRRFLKGHNFMPWFQKRRATTEQEQHRLWRQARINADIQKLILKTSELEIVDSFNAIERHLLVEIQLHQSASANPDSALACQKLKGDLQAVFNVLPKDMQQLLLMNPKRAALVQGSLELTKLPGHPSTQSALLSETT